jgi:pyruvate kinase
MSQQQEFKNIHHKTKIVATVGPACESYDQLKNLVIAGVNVFRLNFSHGSHEDKKKIIDHIRGINKELGCSIAILGDLQGPKLRVGEIADNRLEVKAGDVLTFTNEKCIGTLEKIYVSYPNLAGDVVVGNTIMIDDGKIEVIVSSVEKNGDVKVKVINLPDTKISLPALTEKDLEDADFIIKEKLDWVALSFVKRVADIEMLRDILNKNNSKSKIIAKIEMPEALTNIRDIIHASDAIMIARGDLGVELPVEKIPLIQKELIRKCLHRAKPVIVATQMMESMIDRVKPNRSEITDVANAVIEGADAVMLSGETATGQFPVLVIETMRKIIHEVEQNGYKYNRADDFKPQSHSPSFLSDAVCYNGCKLADDSDAKAIIGMTQSGYTAFMLSSFRPKAPLFIFTKEKSLVNQLSLSWGVKSLYYNKEESLDNIIKDQISILKKQGYVQTDDVVVNTGSTPVELHLPTNVIKISKVE